MTQKMCPKIHENAPKYTLKSMQKMYPKLIKKPCLQKIQNFHRRSSKNAKNKRAQNSQKAAPKIHHKTLIFQALKTTPHTQSTTILQPPPTLCK
jgi:hypothetical protein